MVFPIAVCIEYLDVHSRADRYMCCVAPPGYDVALGLDESARVVWRDEPRLTCELWVSADQQLMIVRRRDREAVVVSRSGRSLSLPEDKPVMLVDCDRVDVGGRSVRLHIHGPTEQVLPPAPLEQERSTRPVAAIAAAVAISASAVGCKPSSSTNETPSAVVSEAVVPVASASAAAPDTDTEEPVDAAAPASASSSAAAPPPPPPPTTKPPITVRDKPPKPPPPPPRDGGIPF